MWTNAHAQVPRVIAGGPISSFQHEFSKDGLVLTFHTQGDTVVGSPILLYQLRAFRNGQPVRKHTTRDATGGRATHRERDGSVGGSA